MLLLFFVQVHLFVNFVMFLLFHFVSLYDMVICMVLTVADAHASFDGENILVHCRILDKHSSYFLSNFAYNSLFVSFVYSLL